MATCQITNPVTAILLVLVADRAPVCQVLEFVVEIMLLVVEEVLNAFFSFMSCAHCVLCFFLLPLHHMSSVLLLECVRVTLHFCFILL